MNVIRQTLAVGAEKPFRALHISDTHLTRADARDGQRKVDLVAWRLPSFPHAEQVLVEAGAMANELGVPILHTGDLIDYVSLANLEAVARFTEAHDVFMATGNHEFSLYVGEAKEDAAYRNQSLPAVQACFQNDIRMGSRVIGGVNFVALDNGYYLFEPEQLAFLQQQVQRGLPIVLMMHTPLYEQPLYDMIMKVTTCAYLAGVPEPMMRCYPPDRYEQQLADKVTLQTMEYIAGQPLIKAILAGHLHREYQGLYAGRIPQYVTGCTSARLIEFV